MGEPVISLAVSNSPLLAPLVDHKVMIPGFELSITSASPSEIFWRQLYQHAFDACEMAIPLLAIAKEHGSGMIALPVFPGRRLVHLEMCCHVAAGIEEPAALADKRIGFVEYCQASAVWTRGILVHDFGVDLSGVSWFVERSDEMSHGTAAGFIPPPALSITTMPAGQTMRTMLLDHALDAAPAAAPRTATSVEPDRMRGIGEGDWSQVRSVFKDPASERRRYLDAHGYLPANHVVAVRKDVAEQYPTLPGELYRALVAAKAVIDATGDSVRWRQSPAGSVERDGLRRDECDLYPYGLGANWTMIGDLMEYLHEQGLIAERIVASELFAGEFTGT